MKILPVTSLLVVLAFTRNAAAQSYSGFTAPWNPAASLAFSAEIAMASRPPPPPEPPALTPTMPASVTVVALNLQDVRIAWADRSSNEDGFQIERQVALSRTVIITTTVGTTGPDATSIVDSPGLGTFKYRVRAFNSYGSSAWTKWVTVRIKF